MVTAENEFSSINEFDTAAYFLWNFIKDQAKRSGGMVDVPIALDILDTIKLIRYFGVVDEYLEQWLLFNILYISNRVYSAQLEVLNAVSKEE